jgi:hemoglobin-like flavoprotein
MEKNMTIKLSERARGILAETLPLVEQHREPLEAALTRYVARQGPYAPAPGRAEASAGAIMDMLIGHARQIVDAGRADGLTETALRHRSLALGGEHYSSFGDGLRPILKDVLGESATDPFLAAWTDAYWAIVRALFRPEARIAA